MPDLRTLLHDSAPAPARDLDLADVVRRSRRARMRRIGAWFAGVGILLGVGIPSGTVLVTTTGGEDTTAPSVPTPTSIWDAQQGTTTTSLDAHDPPTAVTTVASSTEDKSDPAVTPAAPEPEPSSAATATTTPSAGPSDHYPPASSCSVDNEGLGPDERRQCAFTAQEPGGFHGETRGAAPGSPEPERRVSITRDGVTRTYMVRDLGAFVGDQGVSCGNAAIRPGDQVLVEIINPPTGTGETVRAVGAGAGWSCS